MAGASTKEGTAAICGIRRARMLPDNRMTWTRYDVKDRTKRSGTRIARERAKEFRNLDNYEGQEKEEVRERGLRGKEVVKKAKLNQKVNKASKKLAAVLDDEHRWPCLNWLIRVDQSLKHQSHGRSSFGRTSRGCTVQYMEQ